MFRHLVYEYNSFIDAFLEVFFLLFYYVFTYAFILRLNFLEVILSDISNGYFSFF